MRIQLAALTLLAISGAAGADWDAPITTQCWRIESPAGKVRWLEIHDLDGARATGLYHVQVLERAVGSQPWQFRSLADHMAVTEAALRASILAVAKEKSVYPETFDFAYRKWKELEASRSAPVCKSEIAKCL